MPPNNLTLKQRLAALSIAPSAPISPHGSEQPSYANFDYTVPPPSSPSLKSPRRKGFGISALTPSWAKKSLGSNSNSNTTSAEIQARESVQQTMTKLIFQAGVDYETRPMVVINASALPDPREINYDVLLSRILSYLNLYVESDYTVVFLAAGGRHSPGWNWVWKAYRSLSRKYRKNLKRLYVVHSTFFTKMLFSLAGAIISPKFFRKISYIDTLSELAYHVPLTQIDIPPAVYQENSKYEKKITLPMPTPSSTFGVPLEDIMGYEGEKGGVPRVVKDTIQYLRETGLEDEGLFRRSPSSAILRAAQEAYDRGNVVSLETFGDHHLAAVLLKKYLKDLPTPIFPETLYPVIRRCPLPTGDPGDMASVMYVREVLLPELPPCTYILLSHVLHLMHDVSLRSASNRMDAHNLAIVLCPNLVFGSNPIRDVQMCAVPEGPALFQQQEQQPFFPLSSPSSSLNRAASIEGKTTLGAVIKLCIQQYYEIFDEVMDPSEATTMRNGLGSDHGYGYERGDSMPEESRDVSVERSGDDPQQQCQQRVWTGNSVQGFPHSGSNFGTDLHNHSDFPSNKIDNHKRHSSGVHTNPDDDEEIDDAMLVMPIGPNHRYGHGQEQHTGNANTGGGPSMSSSTSSLSTKPRPQHRTTLSNSSKSCKPTRSIHTDSGPPPSYSSSSIAQSQSASYATYSRGKARSTISIEKGSGPTIEGGRKGSISIGRGTNRKSTGSGVAAIGVTAEGFFTPPAGVPPVPPLPVGNRRVVAGESNEEGARL
ncbi:Rho GTPase activation protein [Lentinula detonsa]|uniref:Rho GTPase activation protein n=1 Tax=Lentinula detonsa TaxID=2804962 RepID=A0A9W8NWP4_9AGAR|nr:Rho GTPase activation protein [Lentinula detonsa]